METVEQKKAETVIAMNKQIKELKSENEKLKIENQSLHDQITEMESERLKIYKLAAKTKTLISDIQAT